MESYNYEEIDFIELLKEIEMILVSEITSPTGFSRFLCPLAERICASKRLRQPEGFDRWIREVGEAKLKLRYSSSRYNITQPWKTNIKGRLLEVNKKMKELHNEAQNK